MEVERSVFHHPVYARCAPRRVQPGQPRRANFFTVQNIINLITNNWFVIILGIGVTFLLITGNFDMSVGGIIALTGVLSVYFCQGVNVSKNVLANGLGLPYGVAIGLALLWMGVGGINAFFVTRLKVPSIIVTLGTMMGAGVAQVITQGAQRNTSLPDVFGLLGSIGIPGTTVRLWLMVMIALIFFRSSSRKDDLCKTHLSHRRQPGGGSVVWHQRFQVYHLALYSQCPTRWHYRDTPGFRVQGWCFEPCNGLCVSTFWSSLCWEASALQEGSALCLACLSVLSFFRSVTSTATGLLLSPDWQYYPKGCCDFRRDPGPTLCTG